MSVKKIQKDQEETADSRVHSFLTLRAKKGVADLSQTVEIALQQRGQLALIPRSIKYHLHILFLSQKWGTQHHITIIPSPGFPSNHVDATDTPETLGYPGACWLIASPSIVLYH